MSNEHQILARPPRTRRLQQQDNNQTKTKLKYTCDFAIMFVCSFFRFVQWYQSSENLEQSTLYNVSCPCFFFKKKTKHECSMIWKYKLIPTVDINLVGTKNENKKH